MDLRWVALAAMVALAGCTSVPASGPLAQAVIDETPTNDAPKPYVVVRLDAHVANVAGQFAPPGFSTFFTVNFGKAQVRLAEGDQITINIFEAGADGLFSSSTAKATAITSVIDGTGRIFVPYVGTIRAAGRTPEDLRGGIQEALEDKAIQPQVQVLVASSFANSATVLGTVGSPGKIPITVADTRVLDVIAAAGGSSSPTYQTRVIMRRGNKVASSDLEDLFDNPKDNVPVQPGDTILVTEVARTFTVFGAATTKAEVPFAARRITLAEAIAKAGGLNDTLADPAGVFLFRFEPDEIAKQLSERAIVAHPGSMVPVVYQLNLRDPNSFFLMQTFNMRDEDVLYISNHPSVEFNKFLRIIEPLIQQAITALTVSSRLRN